MSQLLQNFNTNNLFETLLKANEIDEKFQEEFWNKYVTECQNKVQLIFNMLQPKNNLDKFAAKLFEMNPKVLEKFSNESQKKTQNECQKKIQDNIKSNDINLYKLKNRELKEYCKQNKIRNSNPHNKQATINRIKQEMCNERKLKGKDYKHIKACLGVAHKKKYTNMQHLDHIQKLLKKSSVGLEKVDINILQRLCFQEKIEKSEDKDTILKNISQFYQSNKKPIENKLQLLNRKYSLGNNKVDYLFKINQTRLIGKPYTEQINEILKEQIIFDVFKSNFKVQKVYTPQVALHVIYRHLKENKGIKIWHNTKIDRPLHTIDDVSEYLKNLQQYMIDLIDKHEGRGSGLIFVIVKDIEITFRKWMPNTGCSYIPLPNKVSHTKGYLNIRNTNNECFKYTVISGLYPSSKNPMFHTQYEKHFDKVNWKGLEFPLEMTKINFEMFEKNNPNIGINVHYLNEEDFPMPYYNSNNYNIHDANVINILFFGDKENTKFHYCLMKDPSKALNRLTNDKNKKYPCLKCYSPFYNTQKRDEHYEQCKLNQEIQRVNLPNTHCDQHDKYNKDCIDCKTIYCKVFTKFKHYKAQQEIPVKIICDIEAINENINEELTDNTTLETIQKPFAYGMYIDIIDEYKDYFPNHYQKYITYKGPDMDKQFIKGLKKVSEEIASVLNKYEKMNPQQHEFMRVQIQDQQVECYICNEVTDSKNIHVDHDHMTGEIRGYACKGCNINYTMKRSPIPVIFHNFKGYDSKMILHALGNWENVIYNPVVENREKIKCLKVTWKKNLDDKVSYSIQFMDSLAHLNSSIEKLVENLANYNSSGSFNEYINKTDIKYLRDRFPNTSNAFKDDVQFKALLRKGVFPYDWFDDPNKTQYKKLLNHKDFHSKLKGEISEKDYEYYKYIYQLFKMKSFEEYLDLYLKLDVLLLADIIKQYTKVCMQTYQLDPFWFITAPSLSWHAMLKYTKVKLRNITDINQYLFFEKGIRGGVSFISGKYKDVTENKDEHIHYIDANNLYGYAMKKALPTGYFKWVEPNIYAEKPETKYIYEVDLEYPNELHKYHNDFPLAPERIKPKDCKIEKLIPHLGNRKNYIVSGKCLELYCQLGLKLTKIHRVLEYKCTNWLEKYIDLNTKERINAKDEFEKDFYKLMNNSIYGQTLMDARKFMNYTIYTDRNKYRKMLRKSFMINSECILNQCNNCKNEKFEKCTENNTCVVGVERIKSEVTLNRPIYVGFMVLEYSKYHMYDFWYNKLKPIFKDRLNLLGTDTDSFIYSVKSDDVMKEYKPIQKYFDYSNIDKSNKYFNKENTKIPGKFKIEFPNDIINKFVGLRSKCYSFQYLENGQILNEHKRAKGVNRKLLNFDYYENVIKTKQDKYVEEYRLQSKNQFMYLAKQNKLALSFHDDKRGKVLKDYSTLALGYNSI